MFIKTFQEVVYLTLELKQKTHFDISLYAWLEKSMIAEFYLAPLVLGCLICACWLNHHILLGHAEPFLIHHYLHLCFS